MELALGAAIILLSGALCMGFDEPGGMEHSSTFWVVGVATGTVAMLVMTFPAVTDTNAYKEPPELFKEPYIIQTEGRAYICSWKYERNNVSCDPAEVRSLNNLEDF